MKAKIQRMLQHARVMPWQVRRIFSKAVCQSIEQSIAASEQGHHAEIRFVVEASLDASALWHNMSARDRAVELFSGLRIWDTEHNTGVLVYALLAERQLEIVADRGISAKVAQAEWDAICAEMTAAFRAGQFAEGTLAGLQRIDALLDRHFPQAGARNPDELPNTVLVL